MRLIIVLLFISKFFRKINHVPENETKLFYFSTQFQASFMIFEEYISLGESMPNVLLQAQVSATKTSLSSCVYVMFNIVPYITS